MQARERSDSWRTTLRPCGAASAIDVSKDALDIFIDSSAEAFQVTNQAGDTAALVERLRSSAPDYIINWWWWLCWCRKFVIHGVVRCPDGSPVPGATVCAYDVDGWWRRVSKQLVGCATTDINGAFTITFRWCCGWWPWWWWKYRVWQLEPFLVERILPALYRDLTPGDGTP